MILQIQTPQLTGKINRAGNEHALVISVFRDLICFCCRVAYNASFAACCEYLSQTLRIFRSSVLDSGRCVGAASHISRQ